MPEIPARWLSASVALIVPFDDATAGAWRDEFDDRIPWRAADLARPHSGVARAAPPSFGWFSGAINAAISVNDYSSAGSEAYSVSGTALRERMIGPNERDAGSRFAALGLELLAVELRCYGRGVGTRAQRDGFAIVHVGVMDDTAEPFDEGGAIIADPARIARAVRRPTFERDFGRELVAVLAHLLATFRIRLVLANGGWVEGIDREQHHSFPFVITHAVASRAAVPRPALLAEHTAWAEPDKWTWAFASGSRAGVDLPHDSAASAGASAPEISHLTSCRVGLFGAGFVGRDGLELETGALVNNRIRALVHTRYLDVFVLALRQKAALSAHEARLAAAARSTGSEQLEQLLATVEALDRDLVDFRLNLWFTQVPEHNDGTALLQAAQEALGLTARLEELARSQSDLRSLVQLHSRRAEERERDRAAATASEADRRERRFGTVLAVLGAAAVAPSVVFGFTAVAVQPDWTAASIGALVAAAGTAATFLLVRRLVRPRPS
ncbi:hypothetical protein HQQ81_13475 [Microbacteriaceae bacterium VKM Ac-2854]|nr:hypothetical protein [Microbacteriaceae bacterium VKM Ac-2854]